MGSTALAEPLHSSDAEHTQNASQASEALQRLSIQHEEARADYERLVQESEAQRPFANGLMMLAALFVAGCVFVWYGNAYVAPTLYDTETLGEIAAAHVAGKNYAVHDLNINIRDLRNEHLARMEKRPDIGILGASHWQEAHVNLIPYKNFYNSHVHRDYWEDMLAMVHMYETHDKLPDQLIIVIRDNLFWPIKTRPDHLWLPGIKYYRPMAKKLNMQAQSYWSTMPVQTWRELISLPFLKINAERHFFAPVDPAPTDKTNFDTLDVLLPGGSILWSNEHWEFFQRDNRSERVTREFAEFKKLNPPQISQRGVENIDALLAYLTEKGVEVFLAHPPFNPIFWDAVQGSDYIPAMQKVEEITRNYADKYGMKIIGGFNPHEVGCTADQYIDAEHSNATCLKNIFQEFSLKDGEIGLRGPVRN